MRGCASKCRIFLIAHSQYYDILVSIVVLLGFSMKMSYFNVKCHTCIHNDAYSMYVCKKICIEEICSQRHTIWNLKSSLSLFTIAHTTKVRIIVFWWCLLMLAIVTLFNLSIKDCMCHRIYKWKLRTILPYLAISSGDWTWAWDGSWRGSQRELRWGM